MEDKACFIMKPKVDFCFKELMTDPEVRRGFIAALLRVGPETIMKTTLLPTHLRQEYGEARLGILDVRVELNEETQIDMEIQIAPFPLWAERSVFYLSKMYVEQISAGEEYSVLKKCIHVGILDFKLFADDEEYYSRFHLWEDSRKRMYTDKMEIHILELPKLAEKQYPENELLDWARFINAEKREEFKHMAEKNEYLGRAYDKLNHISADEEKRLEYEAREKAIRDHNYLMEENRREGFRQGEKIGEKIGEKRGKNEGEKKMAQLIIKMLENDESAQVPRLISDPEFLDEMYKKYNL